MLKFLSVEGFLGIKERKDFAFSPGNTLFIGATGSGKTSAVAAIRWAFFGTTRVKKSIDSIVNNSSNAAIVTVVFSVNDVDYKIVRERHITPQAKTVLRLYRCGAGDTWTSIGGSTVTGVQKKINSVLGADTKLLETLMFSERESFALARPEERRKTLLSLLPDTSAWEGDFSRINAIYKAEKNKGFNRILRDIEAVEEDIDNFEQDLADVEDELSNFPALDVLKKRVIIARDNLGGTDTASIATRVEALRKEREDVFAKEEQRRKELYSSARDVDNSLDSVYRLYEEKEDLELGIKECDAELEELRKELAIVDDVLLNSSDIDSIVQKLAQLRARRDSVDDSVGTLSRSVNGCCPTCRTELGEDSIALVVDTMNAELSSLDAEIQVMVREQNKAAEGRSKAMRNKEKLERSVSDARDDKNDYSRRLDVVKVKIEDAVTFIQNAIESSEVGDSLLNEADLYVVNITEILSSAPVELAPPSQEELFLEQSLNSVDDSVVKSLEHDIQVVNSLLSEKKTLKKLLDSSYATLNMLENELKVSEERMKNMEILKDACSTKGIQTWLMSGVLDTVAVKHNEVLTAIGFPHISVRYTDEKNMKSGKVAQTLDIMATINGFEMPVEALSGGERAIVSLTASIALYSVLNGDRTKDGFIVMDESLFGLDGSAAQMVSSVLGRVSSFLGIPQILLITHDSSVINNISASNIYTF